MGELRFWGNFEVWGNRNLGENLGELEFGGKIETLGDFGGGIEIGKK